MIQRIVLLSLSASLAVSMSFRFEATETTIEIH